MIDEAEAAEIARIAQRRDLQRSLIAIEKRAKKGEIAPKEADAAAIKLRGRPLEENANSSTFDVSSILFWPIPMVLTWIIWRTNEAAREVCPEYRSRRIEWREHQAVVEIGPFRPGWHLLKDENDRPIWEGVSVEEVEKLARDGPYGNFWGTQAFEADVVLSFDMAKDDLWSRLGDEKLSATGIQNGESQRKYISALEWADLVPNDVICGGPDDIAHFKDHDSPRFQSVLLLGREVQKLWPPVGTTLTALEAISTLEATADPNATMRPNKTGAAGRPSALQHVKREAAAQGALAPTEGPSSTAKPAERRGRKWIVDWKLIATLVYEQCDKNGGAPDAEMSGGWRSQADVERFVKEILKDRRDSAGKTAIRQHSKEMIADYLAGKRR